MYLFLSAKFIFSDFGNSDKNLSAINNNANSFQATTTTPDSASRGVAIQIF